MERRAHSRCLPRRIRIFDLLSISATWVSINNNLPSDQRPILCSSETFRKRCLINHTEGNVTEMIIHGVASVFYDPQENALAACSAQIIGKIYYADLGCHPLPNDTHIDVQPLMGPRRPRLTHLLPEDLGELCKEDETMIIKAIAGASDGKNPWALYQIMTICFGITRRQISPVTSFLGSNPIEMEQSQDNLAIGFGQS